MFEDPGCNPDFRPPNFFDAPERVLPSICISVNPLDRLEGPLLFCAPLEIRFNGVSGVSVVWGAGGSEWLETLWTPATTEAAVVPDLDPLFELLPAFLLVCDIGNEAMAPFGAVGIPPLLIDAELPPEETLLAALKAVAAGGFVGALEIEGNPEAVEEEVLVDRPFVIVAGVGTSEAVELLAGSSYEGGGNTGFDDAFPVLDGPPPPVRRRGVEPAAPLAALKACSTICC